MKDFWFEWCGRTDGRSEQVKPVQSGWTSPKVEGIWRRATEKEIRIMKQCERKLNRVRVEAEELAASIEEKATRLEQLAEHSGVGGNDRRSGEGHLEAEAVAKRRKREEEAAWYRLEALNRELSDSRVVLRTLKARLEGLESRLASRVEKVRARSHRSMMAYWRGLCRTSPAQQLPPIPAPANLPVSGLKLYYAKFDESDKRLRSALCEQKEGQEDGII